MTKITMSHVYNAPRDITITTGALVRSRAPARNGGDAMTNETPQHCETCDKHVHDVYPLHVTGLKGKRNVCASCLRSLRSVLPETKLIKYGTEQFQQYWEVTIPLPTRNRNRAPVEMELTPWQAGLLRLAGYKIEGV